MIISEMQSKLAIWSTEDPHKQFTRILRLITQPIWLSKAAEVVLSSKGGRTPGIDGMTCTQVLNNPDHYLDSLRKALLDGSYKPKPVKRIYIPKPNGKLRPLGIPCLLDRIVQRAMVMAMEPIWESDFHRCSYGFRPSRSVHNAVKATVTNLLDSGGSPPRTRGRWVIEGDLSSYFDTVHHKLLIRCVKRRIRDKRMINLLWRFLKAGHIDRGIFQMSNEGVPQGGIISPLLSNIMLHEFDNFMATHYTGERARNRRRGWNTSVRLQTPIAVREARTLLPLLSYVRYADDFIIVVKGNRQQAEEIKVVCQRFLHNQLKLTLNMEKTHITHVNDGFVFLGHRIIRKRSGRGHMRPVTGIPRESSNRFAARITKLLSSNYSISATAMISQINRMIKGWSAFYRHTTYTGRVFAKLDTIIFWKLGHWLARKYRKRVNKLMRKWYRYSHVLKARSWCVSRQDGDKTVSAVLAKCSHTQTSLYVPVQPTDNPFIRGSINAGGGHMSYQDIATVSDT